VDMSPEAFLDGVTPAFSDDALALRFADRHEGAVRFVAAWGQWFRYDGKVWRPDATLHAFDLARRICRDASAECNGKKGEKAALGRGFYGLRILPQDGGETTWDTR
jgi:phage/plasmid-associated DNA primase